MPDGQSDRPRLDLHEPPGRAAVVAAVVARQQTSNADRMMTTSPATTPLLVLPDDNFATHDAHPALAAKNKFLARSNKSRTGGEATKPYHYQPCPRVGFGTTIASEVLEEIRYRAYKFFEGDRRRK
jgi:hypothetical protein